MSEHTYDPPPEVIAEMTAVIRAGWTEEQRQRRMGLYSPTAWRAPRVRAMCREPHAPDTD